MIMSIDDNNIRGLSYKYIGLAIFAGILFSIVITMIFGMWLTSQNNVPLIVNKPPLSIITC